MVIILINETLGILNAENSDYLVLYSSPFKLILCVDNL